MKILFIGNSYTYYHDMPERIFAPMAQEAGLGEWSKKSRFPLVT